MIICVNIKYRIIRLKIKGTSVLAVSPVHVSGILTAWMEETAVGSDLKKLNAASILNLLKNNYPQIFKAINNNNK